MSELRRYKITVYADGVKKTRSIFAHSKAEAKQIGLELFFTDSICVSEVADNER